MRFYGGRLPDSRAKAGSVWLAVFCGMVSSWSVLLLTLAAFGMTAWLHDTSPTWEKRLDAGATVWIVALNASNLFLLPASAVAGLNFMRVLNSSDTAWGAVLPVLVMDVGLLTGAISTVAIAISPMLTTALAHWLTLLNITNVITAFTVCVALWAGNRSATSSWGCVASYNHRFTLIVVAVFCCLTSAIACVGLLDSSGRWAPDVITTTVVEATVVLLATALVWRTRHRSAQCPRP